MLFLASSLLKATATRPDAYSHVCAKMKICITDNLFKTQSLVSVAIEINRHHILHILFSFNIPLDGNYN